MRAFLTALVLIAAFASPARAETVVIDSLEWMAADAPVIVRAKVSGAGVWRDDDGVTYRHLTLAGTRVIKGGLKPEEVAIWVRVLRGGDDPVPGWVESGHEFLFFLVPGDAKRLGELGDFLALRDQTQPPIDLNEPRRVFSRSMKAVKSGEEILRIVEEWSRWEKPDAKSVGEPNVFKPQAGYLRLEAPMDSDVFRELWGGSAVLLNVPADESMRETLMAMTRGDIPERGRAAEGLRNYPGPATVARLRQLLNDPAEAPGFGGPEGGLTRISYPVRQRAAASLRALGEDPGTPVLEREPTAEELAADRARRGGSPTASQPSGA